MATVTGSVLTVIPTACTIEDPGAVVRQADDATSLQTCMDGLATIKSGNCTIAGVKTFSGACIFSVTLGAPLKAPEYQFGSPISITRTGYSTPVNQAGSWAPDVTTGQWSDAATGSTLFVPVDLPTGALLSTVHVYLKGHTGHGGVLPTLPTVTLGKRVLSTNAATTPTQSGGTDPSASAAAYEAIHTIDLVLTGTLTINRATGVYYLVLTGEGGGSAQNGLIYAGVRYDYGVTEVGID